MKKWFKVILLIVVVIIISIIAIYFIFLRPKPLPISADDRAAIVIMPLPASLKVKNGEFHLTPAFGVSVRGPKDELVSKALARFKARVSMITGISYSVESGEGLRVEYSQPALAVQPVDVDESYEISITSSGIALKSVSGYGVMRALESLLQLLNVHEDKASWPALEMKDAPRYAWRGLMIDVGRHFIPKEIILRNLDAMAAVKMNVFHWHLSDYQGFRVESKVFPKLHELGSNGEYYTQEDIQEIVSYARDRGIRVVPEFDLPGHSSGILVGYPELASAPGPYQLETRFGIFEPVIDPTREEVYEFLDKLIAEMTQLFSDDYFHIGGDEVNYAQWTKNPQIQSFMKMNNITDNHALQAYFNQRMEKILTKHNKKMVGWDEILNPNLSNNIVVQSWRSHKSLFQAVQKGSNAILSAGYYLDHKAPASKHYGVDPEVMPGAVTIKPDSLNWQEYFLEVNISETKMPTTLIFFGESDNLRGLFSMMDNATAFESAVREGEQITFSFPSDYGEISCEVNLLGDSVSGKISLGLLSFPFNGKKIGGNDVAGTLPPKVEQIKPLTEDDKKRILGGEAAMWTELSSATNIESRIWPRAAAMAEKWWSPAELTKDTRDMYRRLEVMSGYLEELDVKHNKNQELLIADLAEGKDLRPVQTLIYALQEVTLTERLGDFSASTNDPLNEVVDAAAPESLLAVKFNQKVDDFLADSNHNQHKDDILKQLTEWRNNHAAFLTVSQGNTRLEKVVLTSEELSMMSNFALQAVNAITGKTKLSKADKLAISKAISSPAKSRAGVYIAVRPALQKLVDAIPESVN